MAVSRSSDRAAALDDAVRRVRAGDREAFREVIRTLNAPLRVLVGSLLSRETQVDDLVQEAFISAYLRLDEYQLGTDFTAWARTLARHIALNERRRNWRRRGLAEEIAREVEDRMVGLVDQLSSLISTETNEKLRECIAELDEVPRRIIDGFYLRGLGTKQLGERERRPEPWVRVVLFRARAALARCLDNKGAAARG